MDALAISSVLNRVPLLRGLGEGDLQKLAFGARELQLAKGERLFQKGDSSRGFYFVFDGRVKLAFISGQGAEKVMEIAGPGMTFGEAIMMTGQPYPIYAEVLVPSRLIHISRAQFMEMLKLNHGVGLRMIAALSDKLYGMVTEMESFCLQTSRERVVGYLLREVEQRQRSTGALHVELPDTKANTASLLNLTPETFSRVIRTLEREKVIEVSGRQLTILDPLKLKERHSC